MRLIYNLTFAACVMLSSCSQAQKKQNPNIENLAFDVICTKLMDNSIAWTPEVNQQLSKKWETGSVPVILEMDRFIQAPFMPDLFKMMNQKTGQSFAGNTRQWQNWLWQQKYKPLPGYPNFKSNLYRKIDPRFADYFKNNAKTTIRLDEVVWGGVQKDGIPPLRNPQMISATNAKYLGNNDIVFGIEVNGEPRAYPKRILAWHEMFTDTIQGIPLAGVY